MVVTLVLAISVLLQFSAAILALRLIRVTGRRTAWALIATAVFLMAVRRSITLFRLLSGDLTQPPDLTAELVALVISVLMVAGIARIAPLFHAVRQSEEALRGSQERLGLMVEQVGAILWTTDSELRFTSSQGAELAALNLQPDQIVGRTLCEYFQTDDPEFLPIAAHRHALRGEPVIYEQTWAGNTYQTHLEPLRDVAGDIVGVIGVSLDITERRRVELELLEAERRFRTLLDNVRLVAVGLDQDGNVAYANPHFLALTRYTLDKVLGKDWFQTFIPERERPVVGTVFSEIMEAGIHPHYENHLLTKEGEERLIAWNNTLLLDPDGKPVGAMSIGEDITERKRVEEELKETYERLTDTLEGMTDGFVSLDNDWIYSYVNAKAGEMFGRKPKELVGRQIWTEFPEGVGQPFYENYYKAAETRKPISFEDYYEPWDRWFENRVIPSEGGLAIFFQDITERKQAEAELRVALQKRKELEFIVNKSHAMVFLWRAAEGWPVEFVSENVKQLGYTPEDFVEGHIPYANIIHSDDLERVGNEVAMYSEQRVAEFTQEYRIITKSGDIRWTEDITWIRRDQNGDITHYQGIVFDITERKQAEETLRQRAQELAALNAVGRQVSASLSPDQVAQTALEAIAAPVAPDLALFFLREGDSLFVKAVGPQGAKYHHAGVPEHRVGECLCGLAVSQGEPLYSSDIHCDARCTWNECKKAGLRSFAALPLHGADEVIGVLGLASAAERDFSQQAEFLETLTGQIAIAMQNALLHEEIQRHVVELEQRVAERTAELKQMVNLMAGREVRMAELKDVVRQLRAQLEAAGLEPTADDPLADYMVG